MLKVIIYGRPIPTVSDGFVRGLAQMSSLGRIRPQRIKMARSATEALRGDWVRIGGDMGQAIEKVRLSGQTIQPK